MNYNKILLLLTLLLPITAKAFNDNKGEKSNIVCFVRFADEDADIFDKPLSIIRLSSAAKRKPITPYITISTTLHTSN